MGKTDEGPWRNGIATGSEPVDCRFESCGVCYALHEITKYLRLVSHENAVFVPVAQWITQFPPKEKNAGSRPVRNIGHQCIGRTSGFDPGGKGSTPLRPVVIISWHASPKPFSIMIHAPLL